MQAPRNPDRSFWAGKRVLVTGHTGFKGAWLSLWLTRLGARVTAIGLEPATSPSLFDLSGVGVKVRSVIADIRDAAGVAEVMRSAEPEIVVHLAAQALVRPSYQAPLDTFSVNVQGTANVLDAVRGVASPRVLVAITTDKVYRNLELPVPYRESDALGGHDPYSASKAACEIVIDCYREAFLAPAGVAVASARAGNVIGGGDWSLDRLVPDAVRAWGRGETLSVRRPNAVRPWQHVLEPLSGYLVLAEQLWSNPALAGAYNFGPYTHEAATVRDVVEIARRSYGGGDVAWGDGSEGPHEAGWLALEVARARHTLGITPRWGLEQSVARTMRWYRELADGANAADLCERDIAAFAAAAADRASS